ncbi:hypothetical protein EDB81DRAFT_844113 [Dactylonectria macrodidyma]|uniref:Gal80p-like C-terminal domain-containing protein n=1 Tax=Dactylonectria macrodidyma TaxID=307937 RepID=A0A9P9EQ30_9HYPO|nr:hypothetical protein EDB81DRAFT_844113 [Dactylonectria macrodidyma]
MAPIRLGIIGLSATNLTGWAGAAHLPYLLSPRGKDQYKIVALCNSSIDPSDLAQDANVDFVVCSTRVDKHYETVKPTITAGKAAFVEWPSQGIKSVIGLQGPVTTPLNAVREILEQGRIGRGLSSEMRAKGGTSDRDTVPESLRYFTRLEVGGNAITIGFGHCKLLLAVHRGSMLGILTVLGVGVPAICTVVETITTDVPDLAFVTAVLKGNEYIQDGATLLISFRRGQPFPGMPHLTWTIHGEKGEIDFNVEGGTTPRTMASRPVKILLHDFTTDQVRDVDWGWEPWRQDLPVAARGVAGLYELYARGDKMAYSDFEHALKRHEQLEEVLGAYCLFISRISSFVPPYTASSSLVRPVLGRIA